LVLDHQGKMKVWREPPGPLADRQSPCAYTVRVCKMDDTQVIEKLLLTWCNRGFKSLSPCNAASTTAASVLERWGIYI